MTLPESPAADSNHVEEDAETPIQGSIETASAGPKEKSPKNKPVSTCQSCLQNWESERQILIAERDNALLREVQARTRLEALVDAVGILSRQLNDGNALNVNSDRTKESPCESKSDVACAEEENDEDQILDMLQSTPLLDGTNFSSLTLAVRRMKDGMRLTSLEADGAVKEIHSATAETAAARAKCHKLDRAVRKLWKENSKLRKELDLEREERKRVARNVRKAVHEWNQRRYRMAWEVEALHLHERLLVITTDGSSRDSSASSLPSLISTSVDEGETKDSRTPPSSPLHSQRSPPSSPSESSLVTDDGLPTVRLSPSLSLRPSENRQGVGSNKSCRDDKLVYRITFQDPTNIGLQFHPVPISSRDLEARRSTKRLGAEGKRAPLVSLNDEENVIPVSSKPLSLATTAFLVCGFRGFDSKQNERPTLGARLVAIDELSVELGQWTLERVWEEIRCAGGQVEGEPRQPVSMSFRNDILKREQMALLHRAVARTADVW